MSQLLSRWRGVVPTRAWFIYFKKQCDEMFQAQSAVNANAGSNKNTFSSSGVSMPAAVEFPGQSVWDFTCPLVDSAGCAPGQGPKTLRDVPDSRLSEEGRWTVCKQLWLEVVFPRYLQKDVIKPGDKAFQDCGQKILEAAKRHKEGQDTLADQVVVGQCFAVLTCPWQDTPMTRQSVSTQS